MEKVLAIYYKDYFFSLPARAKKGIFVDLHCENMVGFQEVKPTKM
jgi:hypothetical protein